jgi:putative colanic acid biosynthesis UDP-glucose lipid carrier transferase
VGVLLIYMAIFGQRLDAEYAALVILIFLISSQLVTPPEHRAGLPIHRWIAKVLPRLLFEWSCVVGVLLFLGFAVKAAALYSRPMLLLWCFSTPVVLLAAEIFKNQIVRALTGALTGSHAKVQKYVVIGANELGMELTRRARNTCGSILAGYFDDRDPDRLPSECRNQLLGTCAGVVKFVQENAVDSVYIALPVSAAPRMTNLLNELRDTTASVYFLPDIFSFDVIQARVVEIDGMPVVSICDTPFNGTSALLKRGMDIVLSSIALLLAWPVLLVIAIGVKLSSAGPVLFKQRRYGLNGEEILVYKFRSMRVCEDGAKVTQATRIDKRVTPFGSFLRRTSLDELPQIFNVVQGKMSVVGPRPHAVAHNEQYRKLINGYMIRHKVRPGITGWAQVNGLRGETETIDKMRKRVEYDLDYLRHWSIWMDLKIVLKTIKLIANDSQAY